VEGEYEANRQGGEAEGKKRERKEIGREGGWTEGEGHDRG